MTSPEPRGPTEPTFIFAPDAFDGLTADDVADFLAALVDEATSIRVVLVDGDGEPKP